MTDKVELRVFYDGDCPFCAQYVAMVRLRENFDVTLVDLRASEVDVVRFRELGLEPAEGMIVEVPGQLFYGADAMNFLSLAATKSGGFNRMMGLVFRNKMISTALYPALKLGRRAALALMGKSPEFQN